MRLTLRNPNLLHDISDSGLFESLHSIRKRRDGETYRSFNRFFKPSRFLLEILTEERAPVINRLVTEIFAKTLPLTTNRSEATVLCDVYVDLAEVLKCERRVIDILIETADKSPKRLYFANFSHTFQNQIVSAVQDLVSKSGNFRFLISAIFSSSHFMQIFQETCCEIDVFPILFSQ